jgi:hypothetical protein
MYVGFHAESDLSDFNQTWNFLNRFLKNPNVASLMKIQPVGSVLFPAVRKIEREKQMDRHDKAKSNFLQFCEHT